MDIYKYIKDHPIVPIYYNDQLEECIESLRACYRGGIRVFEFVHRGAHAINHFKELKKVQEKEYPDMFLGIGTIKSVEMMQVYKELGAAFMVSPMIMQEMITYAKAQDIIWIPGCMTPTEITLAETEEIRLVKLFPGDTLGTGYLKAIKPLFSEMSFMVTGGVSIDQTNVLEWKKAGAVALGVGSKLFSKVNESLSIEEKCQKMLEWMK